MRKSRYRLHLAAVPAPVPAFYEVNLEELIAATTPGLARSPFGREGPRSRHSLQQTVAMKL
jgi:hypothetical protein